MKRVVLLLLLTVSLGADWPWVRGGDNWQPALYTEGRAGNFRKGGGALLFAPVGQDCRQILFAQARAGLFRELYAGTLGGGFRRIDSWWGWGVNAFFDIARSNSKRAYYQGGIGGELFGDCWIFRANGYWPSRNRHTLDSRRTSDVFVIGNNIFSTDTMFDNVEQGYHGFDLEVGRGLQIGCGQLWGYAGYYHFDANKAQSQQGPRLRLEYTLDDFMAWCPIELTLGGEWEHNKRHGSTASGYASVRLPLWTGCNMGRSVSCCESMCRIIGDPVFRNRAIWVDREVLLGNCATIQLPQNIFFFDSAGGGGGTQAAPDTAAGAAASSGVNDILFGLANTGLIALGTSLPMENNQQLYSFGPNGQAVIDLGDGRLLTVRPLSGATANAATLTAGAFNLVNMDADPTVNGLILDGVVAGLDGLNGTAMSGGTLQVTDTVIQNVTLAGINNSFYDRATIRRCRLSPAAAGTAILSDMAGSAVDLNLAVVRSALVGPGNGTGIVYGFGGADNQLIARGTSITNFDTGVIPSTPAWTQFNMLVDNCQFDDMDTGIQPLIVSGTLAPGARNAIAILNSQLGNPAGTGIRELGAGINNALSAPGVAQERVAFARNRVDMRSQGTAVMVGYSQVHDDNVPQQSLVQENVVTVTNTSTGAPSQLIGITTFGTSQVEGCATVRDNRVTMSTVTAPAVATAAFSAFEASLTVDGNLLNTTAGGPAAMDIFFILPGVVTDARTLSPLNNGATVTDPGYANRVIPCSLP